MISMFIRYISLYKYSTWLQVWKKKIICKTHDKRSKLHSVMHGATSEMQAVGLIWYKVILCFVSLSPVHTYSRAHCWCRDLLCWHIEVPVCQFEWMRCMQHDPMYVYMLQSLRPRSHQGPHPLFLAPTMMPWKASSHPWPLPVSVFSVTYSTHGKDMYRNMLYRAFVCHQNNSYFSNYLWLANNEFSWNALALHCIIAKK